MHPRACGKILVLGKMQVTPDVEGRNYAINAPYIYISIYHIDIDTDDTSIQQLHLKINDDIILYQ